MALGGSSYAALTINGKNIKNKSIAGKKLKNRTITQKKVKKNTLGGAVINESKLGQVPSAADADNAANAANAALAAAVADGSIGAGALKTIRVRATQLNIADGTTNATTVQCAAGERVVGGGVRFVQFNPVAAATTPDLTIASSRPVSDGGDPQVPTGQTLTGWRGAAANAAIAGGTVTANFVVYALCLGA
ncbi:MAG TPA: hypothetical protein VNC17_06660 [Thermoleophilaceae bacterium]|nr:hypothetical protein [Thermoleophilaceae bacterium]